MRKTKRTILLLLILLLSSITINNIQENSIASATANWYDYNWIYYKSLTLDNKRAGYVTNITVRWGYGTDNTSNRTIYCNGHCRGDFGDIRFIRTDNSTEIPYWLEPNISYGHYARFWINNSYNDSKILMYYGNPLATTSSNPNNVFLTFINNTNHYSGSTPGWNDTTYLTMYNGHLQLRHSAGQPDWRGDYNLTLAGWHNFTIDFSIEENRYTPGVPPAKYTWVQEINENSETSNSLSRLSHVHNTVVGAKNFNYTIDELGSGVRILEDKQPFNKTKRFRIDVISRNWKKINYYIYAKNETLLASKINASFARAGTHTPEFLSLLALTGNDVNITFINDIRIRPYITGPKPFWSHFSSEVMQPGYTRPLETTNIEEYTATLNGILVNDTGYDNIVGFLVGKTVPNWNNWLYNITIGIRNASNPNFFYNISGLVSGQAYYVKTWRYNGSSYNLSLDYESFITKPLKSSFFRVVATGPSWVDLAWNNPSVPSTSNISTLIVYKSNGIPTSRDDGIVGANVTYNGETVKIGGLAIGTHYNFSAFTMVNSSNESAWADSYSTAYTVTYGGVYNISFYNELNTSRRIDLTKYGPHKLVIHYANKTETNIIYGATVDNESILNIGNMSKGYLLLNSTYTLLSIDFFWNYTKTYSNQCSRSQVVTGTTKNITFYLITNKLVYGMSTSLFNNSIVPYTYSFEDHTGIFVSKPGLDTYAVIYTYKPDGTYIVIHSEYWDASKNIYPWLLYNKKYFIGVYCSSLNIPLLGTAPTGTDINPTVVIDYTNIYNMLSTGELFIAYAGWNANGSGLYVYFLDPTYETTSVTCTITEYDTLLEVYNKTANNFFYNFTWFKANTSKPYIWQLKISSPLFDNKIVLKAVIYPGVTISHVNESYLNELFTIMFGNTPLVNPETGATVSWTYILLAVIAFILLLSFEQIHAGAGGMAVGLWLVTAPILISELTIALLPIGIFIISLSIIYALGGKR